MIPSELEARLQELHGASFGWALNCCRWNQEEAEDVLQTAYLRVLSGKARFGGKSSFRTWLFGVIRRTAMEHGRTRVREAHRHVDLARAGDIPQAGGVPDTRVLEAERADRLREALRHLSERQREILHLVFYQDLSIAEAATVMAVSVGSARTHYERGKARLRGILGAEASHG